MNTSTLRRLERLETQNSGGVTVIVCKPGETPEAAVARYDAENPTPGSGLRVIIRSFREPETATHG